MVQYFNLDQDDAHIVPQRNKIRIRGYDNDGQGKLKDINLPVSHLDVHEPHQAVILRLKHKNINHGGKEITEERGMVIATR